MYIEKRIITELDISDPAVLYSEDMDASLIDILNKRYVGRCFYKCYILNIVRIINRSPLISEWNRNTGKCRVTIDFLARGLVFDKYEVVPDAKVIEIMENGTILLKSKYAAIGLAPNPALQAFRVGQTVPIRVVNARFIPYKDLVSVQGIPFIPVFDDFGPAQITLTKDDMKSLEPLQNKIADEIAKLKNFPDKKIKWFRDMLQPYKTQTTKLTGYELVEISDLVDKQGTVQRPDSIDAFATKVFFKSEKIDKPDPSSVNLVKTYLNSVLKYYTYLTMFAELYEPDSTKFIWSIYEKEKRTS